MPGSAVRRRKTISKTSNGAPISPVVPPIADLHPSNNAYKRSAAKLASVIATRNMFHRTPINGVTAHIVTSDRESRRRFCSHISSAMLRGDSRTNSTNGACGRHERHDSHRIRLRPPHHRWLISRKNRPARQRSTRRQQREARTTGYIFGGPVCQSDLHSSNRPVDLPWAPTQRARSQGVASPASP